MTALFYDIVNSTLLLNTLDPEEFGDRQRAIHLIVASVVQRYDGALDQIVGDGGCAFFGYPVASEDAAESAVTAALEIIQRCKTLPATGDATELQIRVGVATGTVVVNDAPGAGLPGRREIIGVAVNLAARLQAFAAPNMVLVSETTYRLTHSAFDYRFADTITVKGFSVPQPVWQPLEKREADSRFETRRRSDTPFVARTPELGFGLRCWRDAQEGAGRILFFTGESGIGKSRLIMELARHVEGPNCSRRLFQCQLRGNRRPFHPVIDRFTREMRQFTGLDGFSESSVRSYLSGIAPDISKNDLNILSLLAEVPSRKGAGDGGPIDAPDQDFGRAAIKAMIELLATWSRDKPQFIILEDYQWADNLTKSLVVELARSISGMRVLLVLSSREPAPPDLVEQPSVVSRDLSRLATSDIAQMVEEAWKPWPPPKGLTDFIEQRSEGVPLFVEELALLLKDKFGQTRSKQENWQELLKQDGVSTLKDLLLVRIADLGEARRVAQIASVIGREFSVQGVRSIAADMPEDVITDHLETLAARNLIHHVPGEAALRFRHVLFQEAAYDSLLKSEQRELHRRVVAASREGRFPALSDDVMAWHCERAGQFLEAAQHAIKAAEGCAVRSAMREAYNLLASAETCLDRMPPSQPLDDLMLRLLAIRGPIEMALFGSGSREARRTYEEAVAICRGKQLTDREQWFPLYWGWWITSPNSEAVARSQVIVSDLEKAADPEIKLQALHCAWATNFHAGNHLKCLHCIDEGLRLYDPERAIVNRTKYGGHDAKVCALAERGQSLWFCGDPAAAENVKAALAWAEEIGHLGSICHALDVALLFSHFERNYPEVLRLAAWMRDLADKHDLPNCEAKSDIFSGWTYALQGKVAEGRALFEQGLRHQREIGTEEDLPLYLDMRAATLECEGRDDLALQAIEEALDHAKRTSDIFWLPELYRRRARLGERCGRSIMSIRRDLENALSKAVAQGAETIAQRVRDDLRRLDPGRGQ